MGYVTPEQITQAKELDLLTYLQRFDPHELVHVSGARVRGEKFWPTRASTAWVKEKPWTLIR